MGHPTTYATSFRIYIVNNCNPSLVREVVSKKIQTCTFKPIRLQLWQKDQMKCHMPFLKSINRMAFVKPSSMIYHDHTCNEEKGREHPDWVFKSHLKISISDTPNDSVHSSKSIKWFNQPRPDLIRYYRNEMLTVDM